MTRRQYLLLVVPLMAVLIGFGAVLLLDAAAGGPDVAWDPGLQRTVLEAVSREFAGPIDERLEWRAFFNMLNAYLGTFDEYGEVVPPWEVARERERSEGRYGGVGIRVEARPAEGPVEYLEIVGLKSGGPAAEAGARRGDRIVAIDGRGVGDLYGKRRPTRSWDPAAAAVRGEAETAVELTLDRPGEATRVVRVVRAWVDHGSVFGVRMLDEERGIGYVRIDTFHRNTARDFEARLNELIERGLRALVLDLRHNSGGMLRAAVAVADALCDGRVVSVASRGEVEVLPERERKSLLGDRPLVVLVDRGSASASEVVAGALQDHRRAALVGERTFGKFQVQTVRPVPTTLGPAQIKITTAVYLTPNGRRVPRRLDGDLGGLLPDLPVPVSKEEAKGLRDVFEQEKFADWNPDRPPDYDSLVDRPLQAAVALLRGETVTPLLPTE